MRPATLTSPAGVNTWGRRGRSVKSRGTQQGGKREQPEPARPEWAKGGCHGRIILLMTSYLVALAFIAIIASLASALFFMLKDGADGKRKTSNMARALAFRVGFSVLLF